VAWPQSGIRRQERRVAVEHLSKHQIYDKKLTFQEKFKIKIIIEKYYSALVFIVKLFYSYFIIKNFMI